MAIFNLGNHIYMNFLLHNMNPGSYFRVFNLLSVPVLFSKADPKISQQINTNIGLELCTFLWICISEVSRNKHFQACNNKLNVTKREICRKIFQDTQFKGRDLKQPNYTECSNYNGVNTLQKASQSEVVQRLRRAYIAPYTVHDSV